MTPLSSMLKMSLLKKEALLGLIVEYKVEI